MSRPISEHFSTAIAWAGVALLAYLLYLVVEPFLVPLGWACVLAVVIYPLFARLSIRIGPVWAATLSTLAATVVLIAPAVALTNAFAREMVDLAHRIQAAIADGQSSSLESMLRNFTARVPFASRIDILSFTPDVLQRAGAFLMGRSGAILSNVATFFLDLALALFATFFLLRDADTIMRAVRRLLPMSSETREAFIT